jgi:pyruvate/2-oxoglutarate dehydrogenase complex dihydrolipoamide dehydrogenase (E3) component
MGPVTSVVIVGGGPGGYEAALVAAQLGADVTLVDSDGIGGSAVLTDCVPSKAFISVGEILDIFRESGPLGVRSEDRPPADLRLGIDIAGVNERITGLAMAQSHDIAARLDGEGIERVAGRGRLAGPSTVVATEPDGAERHLDADLVLLATGASPRTLPDAQPDGERILTWEQVYSLRELPEHLIVVGSGVTGAEFASAFNAVGVEVTLVSSRDHVLPGEDADAAAVLEEVFADRGVRVIPRARAVSAEREGEHVTVRLADGRAVSGSHCLLAVGSIPNTDALGLDTADVAVDDRGFITVDRVSRTSRRGIYAAGDCTGVLMLASVAAMQGRIAMWHALGDAVAPLDLRSVSANVFTDPEIATVGVTQSDIDAHRISAVTVTQPLATNARAKMGQLRHGFVKLFCRPSTRIVVGGVVVAPRASELIHPVALAVANRLTVDQIAGAFTVYPSLSGSVAEAARRLHATGQAASPTW